MELEELLDAWNANCAINYELLDVCSDEDLELKPGKGKTIRSNFVHIIGFRKAVIEERLKANAAAIPTLDWKTASREELRDGLSLTDDLMAEAFRKQDETKRPARWTTARFFAKSIAHEAHHRSQIEISLRLNGREPNDAFLYGLWDWPKKGR
ncbi:MAG TPA: DinB family protein [Fimbriimonadaceae bacterium]|nr:DinB family protein [Fimbriimonadaceae bacterium]